MSTLGSLIDGRFLVIGICSEAGGMGSLVFVEDTLALPGIQKVIKYCKQTSTEALTRFKREVRLMNQFSGSQKVIQVSYANLDHDPPYFLMDHYRDGDLTKIASLLASDLTFQEAVFNKMIDCIEELHVRNVFHRDIKPQNFLRDAETIVVSDFGLSTELGSSTIFTQSSMWWGTHGYIPPEFQTDGGFKHADAAGDIFMMGKTFYNLITGRTPAYMVAENIPVPIWVVLERCCHHDKNNRYQSLEALRRALTMAYDVILNRIDGSVSAYQSLQSIKDQIEKFGACEPQEIIKLIDAMSMVNNQEKNQLCSEIPKEFFAVLAVRDVQSHIHIFLAAYRVMTENGVYPFSFAERIASNMETLFKSSDVSSTNKAEALQIAILAAQAQNRYAAMDTCRAMVRSVLDIDLTGHVYKVIQENSDTFIGALPYGECKSPAIRSLLAHIQVTAKKAND